MMGGRKPYFPMFVDISGKKIIVAGGGRIAERRVDTLLKFADNITVIAPKVTERIRKKAEEGKLCWIKESFREDMKNRLLDADMVLAATNDIACNEQIMRICNQRGIPVNVSHKKELCDYYFPAVVVKYYVTVGITSGGQSHMQVKKIREQIENALFTKNKNS